MLPATEKAVTLLVVALPTMFLVIGIFILATMALHKAFPAKPEDEE